MKKNEVHSTTPVLICCGQPLTTPFCSQCGAKNEGVIGELLTYLKDKKSIYDERLKKTPDHEYNKGTSEKFGRWIAALNELVAVTNWKQ